MTRRIASVAFGIAVVLAVTACRGGYGLGTAWGDGAFRSNGERIYFTATSERGGDIRYTGGPDIGAMMTTGRLACASCHGADARGGQHLMHMVTMDAPDIRWETLARHEDAEHVEGAGGEHPGTYDLETFSRAVIEGRHPDGDPLSLDMPRWTISEDDLRDLAAYLQTLPGG